MIMLIAYSGILTLLLICLGYLFVQMSRNQYIAEQLKNYDHEYRKLRIASTRRLQQKRRTKQQ